MNKRLIVSTAIGLLAALITYGHFAGNSLLGSAADLSWPLQGARMFLAGANPYGPAFALPDVPYYAAYPDPLFYPLPAVLLLIPLTPLPATVAALVFVGLSAALLAYALTEQGWDRLLICVSGPFLFACAWGQWSPLLLLIGLASAAAPLALCKPNLGLALLAYRPSWRSLILCVVFGLLTLIIWPTWIWEWRANLTGQQYVIPLLQPGGLLLLLAALRWRRPEARLLLVMACLPQNLWFYDQLPLALIPQTRRTRLLWVICSHLALLGYTVSRLPEQGFVIWLLYMPALACLLIPTRSAAGSSHPCPAPQRRAAAPRGAHAPESPSDR